MRKNALHRRGKGGILNRIKRRNGSRERMDVMNENDRKNQQTDRKFYLVLGIAVSLFYFLATAGLFHHLHLPMPIFHLPQLFCLIAVLGVILLLRPLLTPFLMTGLKVYAVLQGVAFLLILTAGFLVLHHAGGPVRWMGPWFPVLLEALTLLANGILLMALWKLWRTRKESLTMPVRIWLGGFALFALVNLAGSVLSLWGGGVWHHAEHHILALWKVVMMLFTLLTAAAFLREYLSLRREQENPAGKDVP